MVQRHLTGGLKYDDNGNLYRDTSREAQSYIGNSSTVDDAWNVFDASESFPSDSGESCIHRALSPDRRIECGSSRYSGTLYRSPPDGRNHRGCVPSTALPCKSILRLERTRSNGHLE